MGGDFAPRNVAQGAVAASREDGVSLSLVGRENDLRRESGSAVGSGAAIEIVDAPEVVDMDEPALSWIRFIGRGSNERINEGIRELSNVRRKMRAV